MSPRPSARANRGMSAQLRPNSKIVRWPVQSLAARKAPNRSGPSHFSKSGVATRPTITVTPANASPLKNPHVAFRVRSIHDSPKQDLSFSVRGWSEREPMNPGGIDEVETSLGGRERRWVLDACPGGQIPSEEIAQLFYLRREFRRQPISEIHGHRLTRSANTIPGVESIDHLGPSLAWDDHSTQAAEQAGRSADESRQGPAAKARVRPDHRKFQLNIRC